jgi:hypothetical protein
MSRALIGSQTSNYPFLSQHVSLVQRAYGFKPSGAFVDLRGFCLTSGTEPPSFANCDASAAQAFHFENDQIHGEDEQTCLQAAPDGTLAFVACAPTGSSPDPAQTWHPADFQIRGYAGMCLYAYYGMEEGDVAVKPCEQVQDTGMWQFESSDGAERFRLRDNWGQCLAMVPSGTVSVGVEPADCNDCDEVDVRCSFEFTGAGQIALDDYCVTEPSLAPETGEDGFTLPTSYTANVDTCSLKRRAAWSLRGRFVNGNNQMLVVGTREQQYRLTAVDADLALPIPESETFDYYPTVE